MDIDGVPVTGPSTYLFLQRAFGHRPVLCSGVDSCFRGVIDSQPQPGRPSRPIDEKSNGKSWENGVIHGDLVVISWFNNGLGEGDDLG